MLATITFLLMGPVLATQDPPRRIDGVARIAGTDRPAARVKLHVFNQIGPAYTVTTDDQGRFQLRWFASLRQFRVTVPGEGFGSTGPIEVKNGSTTKVKMSPLAKFGLVSGKLDTKL